MPSRSRHSPERISIWSHRKFGELDKRTTEAAEERRLIAELTAHVGHQPTAPQRILIKRAARTLVMVTLLERRVIENPGDFGDLALRQLCAFSNTVRLALQAIGLERVELQPPSVADFLKARQGRDAA